MGGTITVDSEPGRGSTFAFTARFVRRPPHHRSGLRPGRPSLSRNLPVLIVDDNATNRHILEEWLRGWQMKPVAVGDGDAALDALRQRRLPRPSLHVGAARRPDAGCGRAGAGRADPGGPWAFRHPHHPVVFRRPCQATGPASASCGSTLTCSSRPSRTSCSGTIHHVMRREGEMPRAGADVEGAGSRTLTSSFRCVATDPGGRGLRVQRPTFGATPRAARPLGASGEKRSGGASPWRKPGRSTCCC